jgi:hypothetical protein
MKNKIMMVVLVALLGVFAVLQTPGAQSGSKGDLVLTSQKVRTGPENADSSVWNQAKEARIVLAGNGSVEGKMIEIKAMSVYTKEDIFFRFEWPDKDKSMNKNRWRFSNGQWTKIKGDEDRLGLVFEINRIDKFATKGCAVLCHNESKKQEEWYYAVTKSKEKADMWHWKALRSNPVGYTEDGYVTTNPTQKPEEGRKRDAGNGTKAKSNRTKDKSKPAYMQDPSKPASIPDSLLVSQAVEIKDHSIFKEGDEIPGYMLFTDWKDSFADVLTQGVWQDGRWTVMMSRKLDTGYDDDLQFNTRKRYPFGMAVFDNAHEHNSYNSEPLKLQFK